MTLTKKETIRRHRLMWNWIAQTSIQEQRCVSKPEAFKHFGWKAALCYCWCCEYTSMLFGYWECANCPVQWPNQSCSNSFEFLYDKFVGAVNRKHNYIESAKIAYQIAELPERKD